MAGKLRGSLLTLGNRARAMSKRVVREVIRTQVERVVEARRKMWPVDTGRSAALLATEPTASGARARGRADYTTAIVSRRRKPWEDLVRALRRRAAREIPRAIGPALLRALRGR